MAATMMDWLVSRCPVGSQSFASFRFLGEVAMSYTLWEWLLIVIVAVIGTYFIYRAVKVANQFMDRQRSLESQVQQKAKRFIESTVEVMLKDERAVTAVYARADHCRSEQSVLFAYVTFFFGLMAVSSPLGLEWVSGLITIVAALVCGLGLAVMNRVENRAELYNSVIKRYEERLGLEPHK
jgi:hypothetical protein